MRRNPASPLLLCSTPREGWTRRDKWHCAFFDGGGREGEGRGEARCTGARGRVKCIMWNGEWIGSAREGEESFEQAPLCAGKLGPFFFERDGRRNAFLFDRNCWYAGREEDTTILFFFFQVERFRIFFLFFFSVGNEWLISIVFELYLIVLI